MKSTTGTREWSDVSSNIGRGCANNCRYCYGREWAFRYGLISHPDQWSAETLNANPPNVPRNKVVMFPTVHDITPVYLERAVENLHRLLEAGNQVLLVSKPRRACIERIRAEVGRHKERLLFCFSIGSLQEELASFWEPGAPSIAERVPCLKFAFAAGFRTSVSMEPMLDGSEDAERTFFALEPRVNDKAWIGRMNKVDERVRPRDARIQAACDRVKAAQTDAQILKLVRKLHRQAKVAGKDSIRGVIESCGLAGHDPVPRPRSRPVLQMALAIGAGGQPISRS